MSVCLWKDLPNGDIEVRMGNRAALCSRSADGKAFIFHHDQLVDLRKAGLLTGCGFSRRTQLVERFRVGSLDFEVEDWDLSRDLYRARLKGA